MQQCWLEATRVLQRPCGLRWQARFFGCALRCVEKYSVKAECDHLNSLTAGLAQRAQDREWPGARDYTGRVNRMGEDSARGGSVEAKAETPLPCPARAPYSNRGQRPRKTNPQNHAP
jgi:hypothetical protein